MDNPTLAHLSRARGLDVQEHAVTDRPNTPWEIDDIEWFAANPERQHRIRPVMDGEDEPGFAMIRLDRTTGDRATLYFPVGAGAKPFPDDEARLAIAFVATERHIRTGESLEDAMAAVIADLEGASGPSGTGIITGGHGAKCV